MMYGSSECENCFYVKTKSIESYELSKLCQNCSKTLVKLQAKILFLVLLEHNSFVMQQNNNRPFMTGISPIGIRRIGMVLGGRSVF